MKKVVISALTAMLINMTTVATAKPSSELGLTGGEPITYRCDNDKKVTARYYNLSDNSLSFVKLTLNGEEYTLPQVVAASGVRYTDELKIEWWTKNGALLDEDVHDDKSKLIHCQEINLTQ